MSATRKRKKIILWGIALLALGVAFWVGNAIYQTVEEDPTLKHHLHSTTLPAIKENLFGASKADQKDTSILASSDAHFLSLEVLMHDSIWPKLEVERQRALEEAYRFGEKERLWFTIDLVYEGDTLPAKIRLRGDTPENFMYGLENASYRINIEEGTVAGTTKFSLVRPVQENGWYGVLYAAFIKEQGLLSVRNHIVSDLTSNQKLEGTWLLQEGFTDALYSDHSNGFIMRFENDCIEDEGHFNPSGFPLLDAYQEKTLAKQPQLLLAYNELKQLGSSPISDSAKIALYDIKKWAQFAAINDVFYAHHSADCHNVRMFYNGTTQLIEPIGWDPGSYRFLPYPAPETFLNAYLDRSPMYKLLYKDANFVKEYTAALHHLCYSDVLNAFLMDNAAKTAAFPMRQNVGVYFPEFSEQHILATQALLQADYQIAHPVYTQCFYDSALQIVHLELNNAGQVPRLMQKVSIDGVDFANATILWKGKTAYLSFPSKEKPVQINIDYTLMHKNATVKSEEIPVKERLSATAG